MINSANELQEIINQATPDERSQLHTLTIQNKTGMDEFQKESLKLFGSITKAQAVMQSSIAMRSYHLTEEDIANA